MEYCLNNEKLCVRVAAEGAQLQSVRGADGTEYLWQGDGRFWRAARQTFFPMWAGYPSTNTPGAARNTP